MPLPLKVQDSVGYSSLTHFGEQGFGKKHSSIPSVPSVRQPPCVQALGGSLASALLGFEGWEAAGALPPPWPLPEGWNDFFF